MANGSCENSGDHRSLGVLLKNVDVSKPDLLAE